MAGNVTFIYPKDNYQRVPKAVIFDQGIDALVIAGTTGEGSTLTDEEHRAAIKYCVERVGGRVPVIAGTGSNDTAYAIELTQYACEAGADAILLVTPYYNKATQKGLYEHFKMIADSVKVPIILYNIPGRTGVGMTPKTIVSLCNDVENIVGVKEASGNFSHIVELMAQARGSVDVYSGNDDQIVPLLSLGGKGVISVLSNVAPQETHDICQKFFDGDLEGSLKIQLDAQDLVSALFCEVNPIPVKAGMNLMGFECGPLRMPLTEMEDAHKENLKAAMKDFGIEVK